MALTYLSEGNSHIRFLSNGFLLKYALTANQSRLAESVLALNTIASLAAPTIQVSTPILAASVAAGVLSDISTSGLPGKWTVHAYFDPSGVDFINSVSVGTARSATIAGGLDLLASIYALTVGGQPVLGFTGLNGNERSSYYYLAPDYKIVDCALNIGTPPNYVTLAATYIISN